MKNNPKVWGLDQFCVSGARKSTIFDWLATIIAGFMVER